MGSGNPHTADIWKARFTHCGVKGTFQYVRNDVRALRVESGASQAELGAALGVSRQTINAIEAGRYNPSLTLGIAIARHFGTTVEEIFHVD